jgi:hypothetical protein
VLRLTNGSTIAVARSRHVVEIRRTTADGFESVKRRVIDSGITRPVVPTPQQIIRNPRPLAHSRSSRASHRRGETLQMATPAGPSVERVSLPLEGSIEHIPSPPEAPVEQITPPLEALIDQISSPQAKGPEPPIDREALGAKLWASFTPRPIPGARGLLAISQQSATLSSPLIDEEPNVSSSTEITVTKPLVEKPASPKSNRIMSSNFDRSDKSSRIIPSLKSLLVDHESRRLLSNTYDGSSHLQSRRSLPQLSASEMQGPLTRSHTISETPRRVRFEINSTNGQPQEYSVKFYKDSKIGEWAPSSPWADDQVLACTSDLKYNLDALLRDDSMLPPPSTPVLYSVQSYSPSEEPSSLQKENLISPPQGTELPIQVSPNSISDSSPMSVDTHNGSDQHMTDEHLVDGSPIAPVTSSVAHSPYTRIKELVKGSFRKVFSTSPRVTPSDSIKTNPTQEAIDVFTDDLGTSSQVGELNHPSSLLDPPSILDCTPSNSGGTSHAPNGVEYTTGFIDSPIKIDGNDGSQDSVTESSSDGSAGHSSGSDRSDDSHFTPRREEDSADAEFELAMSNLKMSRYSREKLGRKRKEREVAAAAQKAAQEAAAAKAKAEAEEAERRAHSHRRMPKDKLVKPLGKDWEAKIREAMSRGDHVALTTTVTGTELRRKDFMTVLGERQWLNDEIINAYLEWIVEYANKKAGRNGRNAIPKVIAHNSFFYKNIATHGPQSVSRWMKRKKAEGRKLLEVETVLIPVNNASHWTIIVVSPKERTIEYLDSFSGASKVFIKHTKEWLAAELGNDWIEEEWRVLQTRSAEQLNGWDCGVFLVTNAECVTGGLMTDSYDWQDMGTQRQRIAAVLLNRGFGDGLIPAEEL